MSNYKLDFLIKMWFINTTVVDGEEVFLDAVMTSLPPRRSNGSQSRCGEYLEDITVALNALNEAKTSAADRVERTLTRVLVPVVSAFGIVGNLLNLIVLTRKRLRRSMDHVEKSAQMGLVALALSDMMVCLVYLVASAVPTRVVYTPYDRLFALYFDTYQEALLNIFLLVSTWLTVTMALSRYLAVCRPMHARGLISIRGTKAALAADFVGALVFNLPRFWHYFPGRHSCSESGITTGSDPPPPLDCPCHYHVKQTGALYSDRGFVLAYGIVTAVVGIFGPLLILTACNVCLVRALRRSHQLHERSIVAQVQARQTRKESRHRITPTLIALIVLFIALVTPSGVLNFFREHIRSASGFLVFKTSTDIFNFLSLINFAVNFVLYCIVNVHFRQTCCDVMLCRRYLDRKDSTEGQWKNSSRRCRVNRTPTGNRVTVTETGL